MKAQSPVSTFKLIFEESMQGRTGYTLPKIDIPEKPLEALVPKPYLRTDSPELPEVSENQVVRHFVKLSVQNHHVDKGFYPLGSCTMKYNPKINEDTARLTEFTHLHPWQEPETVQGALQLMWDLERYLCAVSGMDGVSLQPAAGSQGELTGLLMIRKYHHKHNNHKRYILIPDSAHGTNPASVKIAGFETVQVQSNDKGLIDLQDLKAKVNQETAGVMITNPNTLGLFEEEISAITDVMHQVDALVYMDGANLNALLGIIRPGDIGCDIVHINLHKTFSTPHGGGGPGSGPVAVKEKLIPYLPVPRIIRENDMLSLNFKQPDSIGRVHTFYGNFGMMVRAYTYIRMFGHEYLPDISKHAIVNANYLLSLVKDTYTVPYPGPYMHEFVLDGQFVKKLQIRTTDIAKRLLDYGVHAPTIYFPLIVNEALMIEPTETESKESIELYAEAMLNIIQEAKDNPEFVRNAPHTTPVNRLNEIQAIRKLDVRYQAGDKEK